MTSSELRPTVLLDFDDVLCLNQVYGGAHAHRAAYYPKEAPEDFYEKLFHRPAVDALNVVLTEFNPRVVLTTSWLKLLQRHHFVEIFNRTGLQEAALCLHEHWDAAADRGVSRIQAIEQWLEHHHHGEPILILDDVQSGESLLDSTFVDTGRAILCEVDGGFHEGLLDAARDALQRPYQRLEPWRR